MLSPLDFETYYHIHGRIVFKGLGAVVEWSRSHVKGARLLKKPTVRELGWTEGLHRGVTSIFSHSTVRLYTLQTLAAKKCSSSLLDRCQLPVAHQRDQNYRDVSSFI